MRETTVYANQIAAAENERALGAVRQSGRTQVLSLSASETGEWKKVLFKVHEDNRERIGRDLIEAIYKETRYSPAGR